MRLEAIPEDIYMYIVDRDVEFYVYKHKIKKDETPNSAPAMVHHKI